MPHFALRFSGGTLEQLRDVVADASKSSKDTVTERSWLVSQVNALAGGYALPWRQIEGQGRWQAASAPPPLQTPIYVTRDDLREFRLVAGDGDYDLFLSDKTVARLERGCAITAARNKAVGLDVPQPWSTANEWLESNLVDRIAQARAQLDVREIIEEQRASEAEDRTRHTPQP